MISAGFHKLWVAWLSLSKRDSANKAFLVWIISLMSRISCWLPYITDSFEIIILREIVQIHWFFLLLAIQAIHFFNTRKWNNNKKQTTVSSDVSACILYKYILSICGATSKFWQILKNGCKTAFPKKSVGAAAPTLGHPWKSRSKRDQN